MSLEEAAENRQQLWQRMGAPVSKQYMPVDEFKHTYQGRHWFNHKAVLKDAQLALRVIFCGGCVTERRDGTVEATHLYIQITDDPMTTFKAMAHCRCFNCAMEEYWPLTSDPRVNHASGGGLQTDMAEYMRVQQERQLQQLEDKARHYEQLLKHQAMRNVHQPVAMGGIGSAMAQSPMNMINSEREAYNRIVSEMSKSGMSPDLIREAFRQRIGKKP